MEEVGVVEAMHPVRVRGRVRRMVVVVREWRRRGRGWQRRDRVSSRVACRGAIQKTFVFVPESVQQLVSSFV